MPDTFKEGIIGLIPKLRAYATVLTGSTAEADDLVQDTMVRAWRYRESFVPGSNLKGWIFRILRNEFLNQIYSRRMVVQDVDGRFAAELSSPADQEWRLSYGDLLDGLSKLSEDTREALLLVTATGLTYEEAADVCGCAVGTIKSRVNRARVKLADLMGFDDAPGRGHGAQAWLLTA